MLLVMAIGVTHAGTWKMHNYFVTSKIQNIFDTGDKVYYLNSGSLFQFDKQTLVTTPLGNQNILSDNKISQIYYDWENDLLFIAYLNSNIDVIDGEGKVTNISNIKDMVVPTRTYTLTDGELTKYVGKAIHDITFSGGIAYVAAGYGFVTIDESTLRVKESVDMGDNITVNSAGIVGDKLIVLSEIKCYIGDPDSRNPREDFVVTTGSYSGARMYPIDDHSYFVMANSALTKYDISSGSPVGTKLVSAAATNVQRTSTGFIANFQGLAYYYTIDPTGTTATKAATVITSASSHPNGDGTVWVCDANGLHAKGSTAYYKMNSMTTDAPYWLRYNGTLNKLYIGNSAPNKVTVTSTTGVSNIINTYDGSEWHNATAYTNSGSGYDFVFNPLDPHTYFRATWNSGLNKVTDDVRKLNYTTSNSLISSYRPCPAFDKYGNLWVASPYKAASNPASVLPKDKVAKNTVSKSDWFQPTGLLNVNTNSFQRARFLVSSKNNVKIFTDGDFPKGAVTGHILCWDNGQEDPLIDTYQFVSISHFTDQDNKLVTWDNLSHLEEDREGLIWVGHTQGLFVIDPDVLFDVQPRVTRPFVSKFSEGKGILCEGFSVYDIGVDLENNKWIATNNGLYFVSPDASEVYNHFTIENSDIPSNTVYSVECDTVNNRVYIVTDNGFAEYIVKGDASALNYDNVYAFPNPIEPDFTGMVKIVNLMENSYVTITDENGTIVAQMGPVMGSAYWDGSDQNGERVATGLYNVYAAQGGQPTITGTPHTTIMVIK